MKRRDFIAGLGSAAAWPLAVWPRMAWAQQANKLPRVAVLNSAAETDPEAQAWVKAFVQGSAALGWSDGVNVRIDVRWAGGEAKQIEKLAKELVELHPDVVLAISTPSVDAIMRESRTLPIVFTAVTDPVAQGLVETLGACPSIRVHRFRREFDSVKAAIRSRTFHCGYRSEHR